MAEPAKVKARLRTLLVIAGWASIILAVWNLAYAYWEHAILGGNNQGLLAYLAGHAHIWRPLLSLLLAGIIALALATLLKVRAHL